jgi:type II secretory pathway component PulF
MPVFEYTARDITGKPQKGELDAADRRTAVQKLAAQGVRPLKLTQKHHEAKSDDAESETVNFYASDSKTKRRLIKASKDTLVLQFLKRLVTLLSAGLSLGDATKLLQQRLNDPELKELCSRIWKHLSEGRTLAAAMGTENKLFTAAQCHLVEAGEASGSLVPVLSRMVRHLEETQEVKKRLFASLSYPMVIVGFATIVIGVVIGFLIPRIEQMVTQLGGELFVLARWLLAGSDFLLKFGPFFIVAAIIFAVSINRWRKTSTGKRATDLWLLQLPIIGRVNLYSNIYSTSNLLATLLGSGVNTTEALRLVERTIKNVILRSKFNAARKQIQEGVSISNSLQKVHYMPDLAMDILAVGENTGDLVSSLEDINLIYREELTKRLDRLTNQIAAVALAVAFTIVAIIAFSVALSVVSVSQSLLQ